MSEAKPESAARQRVPLAELRVVDHTSEKDDAGQPIKMIELHWDGKFIMGIYVSRSPGVRVITKYPLIVSRVDGGLGVHAAVEPSEPVRAAMEEALRDELGAAFERISATASKQTDAMLRDALVKGLDNSKGKMN